MNKQNTLLSQLEEIESELASSKLTMANLKKRLTSEDTKLIGIKLKRDEIIEKLRRLELYKPEEQEKQIRNSEIDSVFNKKFEELLERIK